MSDVFTVINEFIAIAIKQRDQSDRLMRHCEKALAEAVDEIEGLNKSNASLKIENRDLKNKNLQLKGEIQKVNLNNKAEPKDEDVIDIQAILDTKVKDLDLETRAHNCLSNAGVITVKDMLDYPKGNNIPNCSFKFRKEKNFGLRTAINMADHLSNRYWNVKVGDIIFKDRSSDYAHNWLFYTSDELLEKYGSGDELFTVKQLQARQGIKEVCDDLQSQ